MRLSFRADDAAGVRVRDRSRVGLKRFNGTGPELWSWEAAGSLNGHYLMLIRIMSARPQAVLLAVVLSVLPASGTDFTMKVTDNGYLDTQGFSVILYHSTYHPVFVDQKNTAMEMILHGQRIATNGDLRLMPTPEQWDLVATLKGRQPDKTNNRLTANLDFPTFDLSYTLEFAPEPGGLNVSINLATPLPQNLPGRAPF